MALKKSKKTIFTGLYNSSKPTKQSTQTNSRSKTEQQKIMDIQLRSQKNLVKNQVKLLQTRGLDSITRQEHIQSLLKEGVSDAELATQLAEQYNLQKVDFNQLKPDPDLCKKIPKKVCEKYGLIPVMQIEDAVIVAFYDPGDIEAKENISMAMGLKIQQVVAERNEIQKMIDKIYVDSMASHEIKNIFSVMDQTEENEKASLNIIDLSAVHSEPVTKTVNYIIMEGIRLGASDIHIEIYEKSFRVRFRVDGCLSEYMKPPQNLSMSIVNRIKVLSKMDISERRLPQDGRCKVQLSTKVVDLRVSSVPVVHGEKIVMRLLSSNISAGSITNLGMSEEQTKTFVQHLSKSQGFILITGPTGSGKTTTIYSGLEELNTPDKNISTAEDPVEYKLQGVNQVQINQKIGLSFANVLRTFLRQDPDVILVGEIRDLETANIAYRAAATGHLVLSTLHTNDTVATVTRLVDIGVPAYSVAENTSLIIAQRLVRVLCPHCKKHQKMTEQELINIGLAPELAKEALPRIMDRGPGCSHCNNFGYKGRLAVFEVLEMTPMLKDGIIRDQSLKQLKDIAVHKNGMMTLRQSALQCLIKGTTSITEVLYGTIRD